MPRLRIIVLEKTRDDADTINYVLWADVPAARQPHYADANSPPTKVSAWPGATPADNAALQNGSVAERVDSQRTPKGTGMAAVQSQLETNWQAYQSEINAYNPWQRYGSTWDGTSWTVTNNG